MEANCKHTLFMKALVAGIVMLAVSALAHSADAASRTLVVNNNTGATITVITQRGATIQGGSHYREVEVPPNTRKSLYHFLSFGENEVVFDARRVRPVTRKLVKKFIAQKGGTKVREVELFPGDFGKTVMFDASPNPAPPVPLTPPPTGKRCPKGYNAYGCN